MTIDGDSFCYPIKPLENERIRMVPFDASQHLEKLFQATADTGEVYKYLPYGPFDNKEQVLAWYKGRIGSTDREFLYTILVKTPGAPEGDEQVGGVLGYLEAQPAHQSVEIGFALTVKKFQRTYVTSNAIGLLLMYCLDPPPSGLGVRRVQWQANQRNEPSIRVAQRMGFLLEGFIRWQRILNDTKESIADVSTLAERNGTPQGPGRHSAMLSMCWDDWLDKRAHVVKMMEPR